MALENIGVKLPAFPDWEQLKTVDSTGNFWDTQELSSLNATLINTVMQLKEVNHQLTQYDREKTELDVAYKHLYRKTLLSSTAKTESQKKQMAELACEELEWKLAFVEEVIRELNRMSAGLRTDLDILKTISFNIRQEMRV